MSWTSLSFCSNFGGVRVFWREALLFYGVGSLLSVSLWRRFLFHGVARGKRRVANGAGGALFVDSIGCTRPSSSQWSFGSRGVTGSSANLMEHRSFQRVSSAIVFNILNIRHKPYNCRKQQILLLLLCCLNGSLKESPCWMPRANPRRNVLEGSRNVRVAGNIPRKSSFVLVLTYGTNNKVAIVWWKQAT